MKYLSVAACAMIVASWMVPALAAGPIPIVAAENFYGDIAQQIGGADVHVTSILSNPDQDPHLFEASPSVARAISAARFVIYSGIDYDPWVTKLLSAARSPDRTTIVVAELVGRKPGDNPHIWYDPNTMLKLARALADELSATDPAHRSDFQAQLLQFQQSMKPVLDDITALRGRLAGTPVTATEPVFGYMFEALGLRVRNQSFQMAVMNSTEPSASDVAAFEADLRTHKVNLLVYNRQAADPIAARMMKLAEASRIPVIGVTETEPPGVNYQQWITSELDAIARALPK